VFPSLLAEGATVKARVIAGFPDGRATCPPGCPPHRVALVDSIGEAGFELVPERGSPSAKLGPPAIRFHHDRFGGQRL